MALTHACARERTRTHAHTHVRASPTHHAFQGKLQRAMGLKMEQLKAELKELEEMHA
jgi:hypothetical protein